MFEVEIKKYVKEGHKGLPCKAAQNAFDSYIEMVIHDITENNPNCTFEEVLEQLGESPKSTAEEFLESQPTELVGQWKKKRQKEKMLQDSRVHQYCCGAGCYYCRACAYKWRIDYKY